MPSSKRPSVRVVKPKRAPGRRPKLSGRRRARGAKRSATDPIRVSVPAETRAVLDAYLASQGLPSPKAGFAKCLRCGGRFLSSDVRRNRICRPCAAQNERAPLPKIIEAIVPHPECQQHGDAAS